MSDYVMTTTAGERRGNLTRHAAIKLARLRNREWKNLRRAVVVRVFYSPTGQEVSW